MTSLPFASLRRGRNKTRGTPPAALPCGLKTSSPRLSPFLLATSPADEQEDVRPSSGHGGDGRSEGEAAGRADHAPPRALGAPATAPPRPRPRPPRPGEFAFGGRPRSPPLLVRRQPQGRRRPRGRDRGAPGQARGPPARHRGSPPRAQAKHAPTQDKPAAAEGAQAGHHSSVTCAGAGSGRGGQAVEAAGADAAAAGRPDVVAGGAFAIEAAQACSLLGRPVAGGDRGGHLLADGRPAAAAAEEAAARRAAAARFALPRAVADGDHRRRLQGAGRGRVAPAGRQVLPATSRRTSRPAQLRSGHEAAPELIKHLSSLGPVRGGCRARTYVAARGRHVPGLS